MRYIALCLAALFVAACFGFYKARPEPLLSPNVKVISQSGHGSGFHIGKGYFITARHVVGDHKEVSLIGDGGRTYKGKIVWTNADNDLALVHTMPVKMKAPNLECKAALKVGDIVQAWGNPGSDDAISTWGKVAGAPRKKYIWDVVVPIDAAIGSGMSGGPVYNASGNVVGVTVGIAMQTSPFASWHNGISYMVPAKQVCHALAR